MAVSECSGASLPWFEELAGLKERIGGLFRRTEPRRQAGLYREGLSGGVERKMIEDGHPITGVFIEKRATLIRGAQAKEATVGVRREPAERHVIQGAATAIAKALPLNPTFAAPPPRRAPWLR